MYFWPKHIISLSPKSNVKKILLSIALHDENVGSRRGGGNWDQCSIYSKFDLNSKNSPCVVSCM